MQNRSLLLLVNSHRDAWDRDYRNRGRLWGVGAKNLPDLSVGSRVLELGCGDGKTLAAMQGRKWDVTALDISPEALRLSCSAPRPDVSLLLADARHLPFKEESFDAVFAFHVTGHMLQAGREQIARDVQRVLRAGGKLFFREFGTEDMRSGRGKEVEPGTFERGSGVITHYFTDGEVAGLFRDLLPLSLKTRKWKMRIKGDDFWRSEVEAIFVKH